MAVCYKKVVVKTIDTENSHHRQVGESVPINKTNNKQLLTFTLWTFCEVYNTSLLWQAITVLTLIVGAKTIYFFILFINKI